MGIKRIHKGKLVRDNIPSIMQKQGLIVHERMMDQIEYIDCLKEKLLEEALEVQNTQKESDLIEELADVYEVLESLVKSSGLSLEQIEEVRQQKKQLKGGFDSRVYVDSIEIDESNPLLSRYQKHLSEPNCIFCQKGNENQFFAQFKHCYIMKDQYPVSPGHLLIIPFEHTLNWFAASQEIKLDIIHALTQMKQVLDIEYSPQGYNIGMNCGETAGQTVMHLHVHLIPRYKGDVANPRGGVRGVIPSKQSY